MEKPFIGVHSWDSTNGNASIFSYCIRCWYFLIFIAIYDVMTDEELLILCAKDYVVKTHKWAILKWSDDTWWAAVEGILRTFTDETLKNAKVTYNVK